MPTAGRASAAPRQVACAGCAMQPLCEASHPLPRGGTPVEARRRLDRGETLFQAGAPQASLFAVRAGFLKSSLSLEGGRTHVVRFLLPGDVAGIEGFGARHFATDTVALDDCEVCEIPIRRAQVLSEAFPHVAAHLLAMLAVELTRAGRQAGAIACLTASQRMAAFLLELAERWAERGYSRDAFRLPMDRRDIANHLGMTIETVSRILTDFRARGWIEVAGRAVEIRDAGALRACPPLAVSP